ncbi:hypothetical protein [Synechococcus sp. MIT S9508]|uniref:hypothetical protein n=1 Tax=Synechococcus sp. MIT S9508 TaxID=1801629 RepID=UPI0007BBA82D|nr:hypothetical protein [Synechococcus sp. MIT S9508]KZR90674.1 hypothetical protein MITS9508_00676 [Synechococcus sp. MIT S9508]
MKSRTKQRAAITATTVICELLGRFLFPNWDVNYLIYGARYYMENGAPWMDVWTGLDTINGIIGHLLGSPELAITTVGIIVAITATLTIDEVFYRLEASNKARFAAIIGTALFFKPTLGGWVSDHVSYIIGLAPAIIFVFSRFKLSKSLIIAIGACLSIGLTLKLNSFLTGYLFSVGWIALYLILEKLNTKKPITMQKIYNYFAVCLISTGIVAAIMTLLAGLGPNLYINIFNTYKLASESTAISQFSLERVLRLPLQINIQEAISNNSRGVLIFVPFVVLFWTSLTRSTINILKSNDKKQFDRHWVALLLIVSTSIVCFSLGRGLSHRLFLLPAGILLSLDKASTNKIFNKIFTSALAFYFIFTWTSLAWAQKNLEKNRPYNSRIYLNKNPQIKKLCMTSIDANKQVNYSEFAKLKILPIKINEESNSYKNKCWNSNQAREQIAGLMHVQEPANALGFSFKNVYPGEGDYTEKWDANKRSPTYREDWVRRQAQWINSHKYPYFMERIEIMAEEEAVPGYLENKVPRIKQLRKLVVLTDSRLIGTIDDIGFWETKWGREE